MTHFVLLTATAMMLTSMPIGLSDDGDSQRAEAETRSFHFEYSTIVTDISDDAEHVRFWMPVPQTDENQKITDLHVETQPPLTVRFLNEEVYQNKYLFIEANGEEIPEHIEVTLAFDVQRHETSTLRTLGVQELGELLEGDIAAPITDEVIRRANEATKDLAEVDEKARAIYNRVLADMQYDKSGNGWGKGDIEYACEEGSGNCSDFHTLFVGMGRAVEIPSIFEIGFPLPPHQDAGEVTGYHCWAWFEGTDGVWRPVDISEADKRPSDAEYFFGTICCNRVAFTRGRDLELMPAPVSGPVNFFIYPIVEINGEDVSSHVETHLSFRNLD